VSRYIDEYRGRFGVEPICRTLEVSASAYYQRASGERSPRVTDDERLLGVIKNTRPTTSPTAIARPGWPWCAPARASAETTSNA